MKRLATPAWLLRHAVMIALVIAFLKLGWWQLSRAEGGNGLSIGYTLEWPAFAAFVVIVWFREVRMTLHKAAATDDSAHATATTGHATAAGNGDGKAVPPPAVPEMSGISAFDIDGARAARAARSAQAETAAESGSDYNQYLAWLAAHPDAKPSDYRRVVTEGVPAHE